MTEGQEISQRAARDAQRPVAAGFPDQAQFGFTKIMVRDLDQMATYYKEVVGMVEVLRVTDLLKGRTIEDIVLGGTEPGGPMLVLYRFQDQLAPEVATDTMWLGFRTNDVDAFVARSNAAGGGVYLPATVRPELGVKVAVLTDPEGRLMEVAQMLKG